MKLTLLFAKGGLQYKFLGKKAPRTIGSIIAAEGSQEGISVENISKIFENQNITEISVISALNKFTVLPAGFSAHELALDLISLNAPADPENEEPMLSVNKKYGVQFYYAFPKKYYQFIKNQNVTTVFSFSGDHFLNLASAKGGKEIHINLYQNQCEFFAVNHRKLQLYNNLDVDSEVDFLYFIMFTAGKIGFDLNETTFYLYGETTGNETFIAELRKFVKNLKISFDNTHEKNFIIN